MAIGNRNSGTQVSKNYWDIEASGQTTSEGAAGKTTQEMKTPSTYRWEHIYNPENNNEKVWILKEDEYPRLWYEAGLNRKKYLVHDTRNGYLYTIKNDKLEPINSMIPIEVNDFEKGTEELSDIIGEREISANMKKVSDKEFEDYNVYEYPICGYSRLYKINIYGKGIPNIKG